MGQKNNFVLLSYFKFAGLFLITSNSKVKFKQGMNTNKLVQARTVNIWGTLDLL